MRLGIIGLPQSGKTTLFNALTRGTQPTGVTAGRVEVHTGVVDVPDARVDTLSAMFKPRKTIYAKVTYADIAGLGGSSDKGEIAGALLNQLAQMDGFIHCVRCFVSDAVAHPRGSLDPARDARAMDEEFILNDQISVERKLEKLTEEKKKGAGRDKAVVEREFGIFTRLNEWLAQIKPLRGMELTEEEEKIISGFGLLSRKPLLVVPNLGDDQTAPQLPDFGARSQVVPLRARLEMDIAQLPEAEAREFLAEYDISEAGLSVMIRASYDLLGLQSFFTVGEDEVRAWTVRRGALAPEAAGVIHTDMLKGFIRAEVVSYDDLTTLGSLAEARAKGRLRLEGKTYPVADGDILNIRFNI